MSQSVQEEHLQRTRHCHATEIHGGIMSCAQLHRDFMIPLDQRIDDDDDGNHHHKKVFRIYFNFYRFKTTNVPTIKGRA